MAGSPAIGAPRKLFRSILTPVAGQGRSPIFNPDDLTVQPMVRLEGYELLFGSGGPLVDVYRNDALALPPLNSTLAQRLVEQTRISAPSRAYAAIGRLTCRALEGVLVRFSELVVEQPWISELDINPLLASPERLLALDARVVLHPPETRPEHLPRPAVRPYPSPYVASWVMNSGTGIISRPIRPEDEPLIVKFHETLSDRSVYLRYFYSLSLSSRVAHDRRCVFALWTTTAKLGWSRISAMRRRGASDPRSGRLVKAHAKNEGEVTVLVSDEWQNQGLGIELFRRITQVAREEKLARVDAEFLPDNVAMKKIAKKTRFPLAGVGRFNLDSSRPRSLTRSRLKRLSYPHQPTPSRKLLAMERLRLRRRLRHSLPRPELRWPDQGERLSPWAEA